METLIKELNQYLSDLSVFYRKLQNYHWNVKGSDFFVVHEKLEEYYNKINDQIDEVAEHILTLNAQPLGTMKDYLETTTIAETKNERICSTEIYKNIMDAKSKYIKLGPNLYFLFNRNLDLALFFRNCSVSVHNS